MHLSRSLQFFLSRVAMGINRAIGRRGSLFRDRHHRHDLETPTETRRALVYVLFNDRKHNASLGAHFSAEQFYPDAYSSAAWFDQWHPNASPPAKARNECETSSDISVATHR